MSLRYLYTYFNNKVNCIILFTVLLSCYAIFEFNMLVGRAKVAGYFLHIFVLLVSSSDHASTACFVLSIKFFNKKSNHDHYKDK